VKGDGVEMKWSEWEMEWSGSEVSGVGVEFPSWD
jgi:hypothetical protein